jgi:predicted esterase
VQGPKNVLDLGGFHWGDDILFDSNTGGLDSDAGFRETLALLTQLVDEVLVAKCGYKYREIVLLGFGQGGMAALRLAGKYCHLFILCSYSASRSCDCQARTFVRKLH